jgi:hypothetical protein
MELGETERKLEAITDEGLFEKMAASVLRDSNPIYCSLVHPGVNADGKTVKSPVDGIGFVTGAVPSHMVIVHHTITARDSLGGKWMHDPSTVKARGSKPTQPAGDILKAITVTREQRKIETNLAVTLVLTTNHEPDEGTVRLAHAKAKQENIELDLWSRSRLAHFLDTSPQGQWLRRHYLGDEPDRISLPLLQKLTRDSLNAFPLPDSPDLWVERELDNEIRNVSRLGVTYLVAGSGLGKSTASYKWLDANAKADGVGLVISHSIVASSLTLDGAVEAALKELHPHLSNGAGSEALALATPDRPFLLLIEDINRSGQASRLAEKLLSWDRNAGREGDSQRAFKILCPIWPGILEGLGESPRTDVQKRSLYAEAFREREGRVAVQQRAKIIGLAISDMSAEAISAALGHDPLLIALHDPNKATASTSIIGEFVESRIFQLASARQDYPAAKYRLCLRAFASSALRRRKLEARWEEIEAWPELNDSDRELLGHILQAGDVIRLAGPLAEQRVNYRHDRVRDWLLEDAASEMAKRNTLPDDTVADPYYAEIIAGSLANNLPADAYLRRIADANPLALFHSLRLLAPNSDVYSKVLSALQGWVGTIGEHFVETSHLRWVASTALSLAEGPGVAQLAKDLRVGSWTAMAARLRNGDVVGGIELCYKLEPGSRVPFRDAQIDHAKHRFGKALLEKLDGLLRDATLQQQARVGVLRLAGHLATPSLGPAIEACWDIDSARDDNLNEYLWAFAECCGDEPERYLKKVCDAWAALPSTKEDNLPSPKDSLAAHGVNWAFREWVPRSAIPYFIERAGNEDLQWQITYMLSEVDNPISIKFIAEELAAQSRRIEGTQSFSPFAMSLPGHWQRHQEEGKPMSKTSRDVLKELWLDPKSDEHLRRQSFRLWAATKFDADLTLLRQPGLPRDLESDILRERLHRHDVLAVPELLYRLQSKQKNSEWWWYHVKYVWSDAILPALDAELANRAKEIEPKWQTGRDTDYQTSDLLMRIAPGQAEALLVKYWPSLQYVCNFVHSALQVATPALQKLVTETDSVCDDKGTLFMHIGQHIGLKTKGHPGISRRDQILALAPYLEHFEKHQIEDLREICSRHGWFDLRRTILDPHLRKSGGVLYEDEAVTFAALDNLIEKDRGHWIDHWLDNYTKTGASHEERIETLRKWLEARRTTKAKRLVCDALVHFGRRSDLVLLDVPIDEDEAVLLPVKVDTRFSVMRRSLI